MPRWQHSSMKCAPFCALSREQDAVVGDDADRIAVMWAKPVTSVLP
jgi:hypothetical protein